VVVAVVVLGLSKAAMGFCCSLIHPPRTGTGAFH
jgi:hypothetical protein